MADTVDRRTAHLLRTGLPMKPGSRAAPGQATKIAEGTVDELVAIVRADDRDDIWRYTIVVDGSDEHIRNAELRVLVRER